MALLDPTKTHPKNWKTSCVITGHLVIVLWGQEEFRKANHASIPCEGLGEVWMRIMLRLEAALEETLTGDPTSVARCLWRVTKTGVWLTMQPYTVNDMELGVQKWRYSLFLRYFLDPP